MRIDSSGYVGNFFPGSLVQIPFTVRYDSGVPSGWSPGIVYVAAPDHTVTEAGVSWQEVETITDQSGQSHLSQSGLVTIDTGHPDGAEFYTSGRDYRVLLFGDELGVVPMQGVCIGTFSLENRC